MWQTIAKSSAQFFHPQTPKLPPIQIQNILISPSPPIKKFPKLSRRELAIFSNSSLLLLLGSQALEPFHNCDKARAEENGPDEVINEGQEENTKSSNVDVDNTPNEVINEGQEKFPEENAPNEVKNEGQEENPKSSNVDADNSTPKNQAFLDISIDGEPIGRIVIGLYGDKAPLGAARFKDLVSGAAGISYRRKEFTKIMPNYVQHGGVRSYGVDAELAGKTGRSLIVDNLVNEWEKMNENSPGTKNLARSVSIIVRNPSKPPPKTKLVARQGKLEITQEEVGKDPNGTEFVITVKDSPELDDSALVVGTVLEGMEVVERIEQVKTVQENTSSPYFRVAKLIGDKRAVVAERGFNRPYSKVIVTNCGLLQ